MARWFLALSLATVAGCAGGEDVVSSVDGDPTTDFEYEPPDVDTGWPPGDTGETGYRSARRRVPDSGGRIQFRN